MDCTINHDLLDAILDNISKKDHSSVYLLTMDLCKKFPLITQNSLQYHVEYLEQKHQVGLIKTNCYGVRDDGSLTPQSSIRTCINRLKCLEIIEPMIDLLKQRPTSLSIIQYLSQNQSSSGCTLAENFHQNSSTIYKNLKILLNMEMIRYLGISHKRRKKYRVTFYGRSALENIQSQNTSFTP